MQRWEKSNQERKNSDIKGRKTIPDRKRLAKSTDLQNLTCEFKKDATITQQKGR